MSVELRKKIGDPFISGVGIEIGAGLSPVHHQNSRQLYLLDKRNKDEIKELFGRNPDYDLISWESISTKYSEGIDFINSHHVIEHISNPILEIGKWISHLKDGGILYCSIPSEQNACEKDRILTPINHILEDYLFNRLDDSYDSKQHIYSFIAQWTILSPELRPWYANSHAQELAYMALSEAKRDNHDLHWHTYDLDTIHSTISAAFYFSGYGSKCLWSSTEPEGSHFLVFQKTSKSEKPECISKIEIILSSALEKIREIG